MTKPVLRFAPSPNGRLHLGHAYSALFTATWAERLGGRFLVRIEDTDPTRSKPEFTEAILADLAWLGLAWEEPVWHQSTRFPVYAAHADRLKAMDLLYPCFCSRTDVAASSGATDPDGAPVYGGTCRHLDPGRVAERLAAGDPVQWRLRMDEAVARTGLLTYAVAQPTPLDRPQIRYAQPLRWGDAVIQRKGTPTSYHLSVVVDDEAQGVTHVTRGRDMEASTDIHVLLQMLLGLTQPLYTFHRLLLDETGRKLSKSRQSRSLADLRDAGWTADAVRAHLGFGS
ncbi:tRNA glutamyl-Q(34) synthetase GluQRS [Devosia sp.]|uniref:tRNA glutamyl-Q(34) synthetase GluQRS n=1 Tax=Devosia sp. TaxID=1871048 RepID=UPI0035AF6D8F